MRAPGTQAPVLGQACLQGGRGKEASGSRQGRAGTDRCSASLVPFSGCHLHRCLCHPGPWEPGVSNAEQGTRADTSHTRGPPLLLADYWPPEAKTLLSTPNCTFRRRLGLSRPKGAPERQGEELGTRSTPPRLTHLPQPSAFCRGRDWEFPRDAFVKQREEEETGAAGKAPLVPGVSICAGAHPSSSPSPVPVTCGLHSCPLLLASSLTGPGASRCPGMSASVSSHRGHRPAT